MLDTDGVNAFAAPGGIVHITKGALGLIKSEAELAGVLGHEIAHVTEKHTVNAIQKNKAVKLGDRGGRRQAASYITKLANAAYDNIVEQRLRPRGRGRGGRGGTAAREQGRLQPRRRSASFLGKLMARNKGLSGDKPNGLFASHPETQERIDKHRASRSSRRSWPARRPVQPRYAASDQVRREAAIARLPLTKSEAKGVAGAESAAKKPEAKKAAKKEEKKGGGMFGGLGSALSGGKQGSTQASASAGGRALDPNRRSLRGRRRQSRTRLP